jgi:tRNA (guanine-N7-)-methyltransferase
MSEEKQTGVRYGRRRLHRRRGHGHIRSFVLRQGRVSNAQQRYYEDMMAKIGVPYAAAPLDLDAVFGRSAAPEDPRNRLRHGRDLGGDRRRQSAERLPRHRSAHAGRRQPVQADRRRWPHQPAHRPARRGGSAARHDRQPETLSGVHIFFPDPWPKARHHKRRLIQPPLRRPARQPLKPGGYIHCATDWENYAEQMLEVLSAEPTLENTADGLRAAPRLPPADQVRAARPAPRARRVGFRKR